jgi:tRNA(fMet)-specific endonuclease VapC
VNGNRIALDATPAIIVLNSTKGLPDWLVPYSEVFLPVPVLAELRFGALNSRHVMENNQRLDRLVAACHILGTGSETARIYAELRLQLKRKGRPIPENDLWIAAVCVEHGIPLATMDDHFANVEGLFLTGLRDSG